MPANLSPAYRDAEERFRAAVTREEQIDALEEMLRVIPKHKGTEKLQANLKSRLAKLRRAPKKKPDTSGPSHHVPKEGAGQVVLVGPPNAGKSSLLAKLTHAEPEVAPYPFTTRETCPGMMAYEDVAIQLVDLPPLSREHVEPWVYDAIRRADLVWWVLDIEKVLEGRELVEELLAAKGIALLPIGGEAPEEPRPGWVYRKALMVLTGLDRPDAREDLELLDGLLEAPWPRVAVSNLTGEGHEGLARRTFEALEVLRVYTKQPGEEPDLEQPFTLPRGATVEDLARAIHRELADQLRFARVWGPSAFDGQKVQGGHPLEEGDVVEIHV